MKYDFTQVEQAIQGFWKQHDIYAKAKALADRRGKGKKRFYFLDGPPYANGKIHLGTAWNKALKDMILRYKRMSGTAVWDRAGYDMHGLPTENATQQELGLTTKEEIEAFGVEAFIAKCKELCITNMHKMNEDFGKMGVWMDFENAYQTLSREYMEGEWWLIKKVHEQGRLYEGLRTMTWCPITESSLAKHELEYKTVTDQSIFVKFPLEGKEKEFLIIWTTTPWTIPFNLAVMANPEVKYVKAKVEHDGTTEYWWVAESLAGAFIQGVADKTFEIVEEVTGEQMGGWRYRHPFYEQLKQHYDAITKRSKKAFTVLLSKEYVDTSSGSGLVHCAPGCGPEDYEVGHLNSIPPFNTLDTKGVFPQNMGPFSGLRARTDDALFIEHLQQAGALVATTPVEHEYPHDWRHHSPVIFRTTKQWFFKVEDLKEQMIKANNGITWMPQAAYNAFDSWLNNLRDNSISKQRYWGTPLPIWRNTDENADPNDYLVMGSAEELESYSGKKVDDLHLPSVDPITIKKDGKTYRRVPDVLDVWVDAGTASWNCLDYPQRDDLFKELFPADFILEGKDQIRGWFNLLHIASMLSMGKPCFSACYMHGFINDAQGRKMSKSLGNYILPQEVFEKYGADTFRYYAIGSANPGLDMSYNFDDVELKHRNLHVFWNLSNFLLQLRATSEFKRFEKEELGLEEQYILSRLHETIAAVTDRYEHYQLNEVPWLIESCLLDLSRTYVQLVREKASAGTQEEKEKILFAAATTYIECMKLFATVAPMFSEQVYQNLKERFGLTQESVHLEEWPRHDEQMIDAQLTQDMEYAQSVISALLAAREKAGINVRWPLASATVQANEAVGASVERLQHLIERQTNIKKVRLGKARMQYLVKPNFKELGKAYGQQTAEIAAAIGHHVSGISDQLLGGAEEITVGKFKLPRHMLDIAVDAIEGSAVGEFPGGVVSVETAMDEELETEGYVRELVRRVQQLRKEAGLQKQDRVALAIAGEKALLKRIGERSDMIQEKVGASKLLLKERLPEGMDGKEFVVRKYAFWLAIEKE